MPSAATPSTCPGTSFNRSTSRSRTPCGWPSRRASRGRRATDRDASSVRLRWLKRCLPATALIWVHAASSAGTPAAHEVSGAAPLTAPASTPPPASRYSAWRSATAQVLSAHGDAGSLATAAALSFFGPSRGKSDSVSMRSAAVDLAAKASELAPEDAGIGWLRLQLCAATAGCDIRDPATTMRWVDADNSAVWLATLAVAQRDRDAEEVTRVLTERAQGSRFDVYRNRTVVLLFDTLKKAEHE